MDKHCAANRRTCARVVVGPPSLDGRARCWAARPKHTKRTTLRPFSAEGPWPPGAPARTAGTCCLSSAQRREPPCQGRGRLQWLWRTAVADGGGGGAGGAAAWTWAGLPRWPRANRRGKGQRHRCMRSPSGAGNEPEQRGAPGNSDRVHQRQLHPGSVTSRLCVACRARLHVRSPPIVPSLSLSLSVSPSLCTCLCLSLSVGLSISRAVSLTRTGRSLTANQSFLAAWNACRAQASNDRWPRRPVGTLPEMAHWTKNSACAAFPGTAGLPFLPGSAGCAGLAAVARCCLAFICERQSGMERSR